LCQLLGLSFTCHSLSTVHGTTSAYCGNRLDSLLLFSNLARLPLQRLQPAQLPLRLYSCLSATLARLPIQQLQR
jgi:hypothetical protein